LEQFIRSDAAKALKTDLLKHALAGSPGEADAVAVLMGAAGAILELTFAPDVAARLISDAALEAGRLSMPQGRA
jgi:hypothetical protein